MRSLFQQLSRVVTRIQNSKPRTVVQISGGHALIGIEHTNESLGMIRSELNRHVVWFPNGASYDGHTMKGGWYWLDEHMQTGTWEPFESEQAAIGGFQLYAANHLNGPRLCESSREPS